MGSVVISGATSGAVTLAVPDEAGTRTLTLPATTGTILTNDISQAGDTSAGNAAAVGYTSAEGLILTGQGSTSDVTIKNDADATVLSIPTGTTNVGIGTTSPAQKLEIYNAGFTAAQITGNSSSETQLRFATNTAGRISNQANTALIFDTNATERVRISNDGKVGIGTTGNLTGYVNLPESDYGEGFNWFSSGTAANRGGVGHYSYESRIYYGASDNLTFVDGGPSGTERMRIDADGKVGIGTATPASYTSDTLVISSGDQGGMTLVSANNVENYISWADGTSGAAQLQAGYIGYNHTSNYMRFGTAATERMRIRSNGQVLINQTSIIASDNAYLQVTGGSVTPVALRGGTNNYFMAFYKQSNNDLIGSITGSSGTATAFNTSSDYRLKENIDYTWDATTRLKQLKPARFNFISDDTNTLVDGFIAHEVQEVVPHAVTGEKDAVDDDGKPIYQGIDQSKLVPLLTASLQEALKRIDSLEEQVNALKGK